MQYDLMISGVGGQGVLSMAWVLDHAAQQAGLYLKQSEVHGMAQRGGAVSASVRLSSQAVASDLIAQGSARMVMAVEPLEALRHTGVLAPDGWVVTDITPLVNQDNYPALDDLYRVLFGLPRVLALDATRLAQQAGNVKAQNMVVLGAAASQLPLPPVALQSQIEALFAGKGPRIVQANVRAFQSGLELGRLGSALLQARVPPQRVCRVLSRMTAPAQALTAPQVLAWQQRLLASDAEALTLTLFASDDCVSPESP